MVTGADAQWLVLAGCAGSFCITIYITILQERERNMTEKNIFLIGFMGAGKTTVSLALKKMYRMELIEMDQEIEKREGKTISEIFKIYGEPYFRELETGFLKGLHTEKLTVISCGGGVPLRENNVKAMREKGKIVWLCAAPGTVYDRIRTDQGRPILTGKMDIKHIAELMEERREKYSQAADFLVNTDGKTAEEIAEEIWVTLEEADLKSGKLYDPGDPYMLQRQQKGLMLQYEYNQTRPDETKKRQELLKKMFQEIGEDCYVEPPLHANWGGRHVHLGNRVYANFNLTLVDDTDIYIGDSTMIGPNVTIACGSHPLEPGLRSKGLQLNHPVRIGKNVWIGAGAILLPGVSVGDNAVIGAGSVVTKDIPAGAVAVGNPCRVIRMLEPEKE